ncbi:putative autotransported protein [Salmonella bongori]|nr:putative autotransported protein [Salmonella bongori]
MLAIPTALSKKASRIVAGAYDYNVVQKGKNWYLTSYIEPDPVDPVIPDPVDPVIPDPVIPDPVDPVIPDPVIPDPVDPVIPDPVVPDPVIPDPEKPDAPPVTEHQFRPEAGSYLANNYAANTLFMTASP